VALVHDPDLLVLDEPFAGLDPVATENLRSLISERAAEGAAVLFSSHQLDIVSDLTDDVVVVANGRGVAAGTITELRDQSDRRVLRVRWAAPVDSWDPPVGYLRSFDGLEAVVDLPATVDADVAIRQVIDAGQVQEVSFEPPQLADVFSELVTESGAGRQPDGGKELP
jgi:ABC-2 type transport system ATP-binding protein